jgi:hypothetical protein
MKFWKFFVPGWNVHESSKWKEDTSITHWINHRSHARIVVSWICRKITTLFSVNFRLSQIEKIYNLERSMSYLLEMVGVIVLALTFTTTVEGSEGLLGLRLLAIDADRGRVVVKSNASAVSTLSVGSEVDGGRFVVKVIRADHIVLVEAAPRKDAPEIWVYLADADGRSAVRQLERSPREVPRVLQVETIEVKPVGK